MRKVLSGEMELCWWWFGIFGGARKLRYDDVGARKVGRVSYVAARVVLPSRKRSIRLSPCRQAQRYFRAEHAVRGWDHPQPGPALPLGRISRFEE